MATAVLELWPGHEGLDRPADRGRLLLRLRVPGGRSGPRRPTSSGSRSGCGRTSTPTSRSSAASVAVGRGDRAVPRRGAALQGRADRGPGPRRGRRDRLAVSQRPLRGPLPRAARALDRAHQGVQAQLARRRLLARRRDPADADPDLRDRVLQREGARTSTSSASSRRGRATTAGSGPSSTCSCSAPEAPGMPFWLPERDGAAAS